MDEWTETEHARLRLRADGVAEIRHRDGVRHTLALAKEQVAAFYARLPGPAPFLVVVGEGFGQDDDAREYLLTSEEVRATFTRVALLFSRRVEKVAVDLFLRVRRPVVPIRAFRDEPAALAWLRP